MQNLTKIPSANAPGQIIFFSFDLRVAFVTTSRLKNCHTSDALVGIRLGRDGTRFSYCLTKKEKNGKGRDREKNETDATASIKI